MWRDSQHEVRRRRSRWRRRRSLGPSTARTRRTRSRRAFVLRSIGAIESRQPLTGRLFAFTLQLVGFRSLLLLRRRPAQFSRQLLDDSHAARCECRTCNSCFSFLFPFFYEFVPRDAEVGTFCLFLSVHLSFLPFVSPKNVFLFSRLPL